MVPPELDGAVVSNDFPVFDIRSERLHPPYFRWVTRTTWFVDACRRASEGSTNRVRLKPDRLLQIGIPLPPLEKQVETAAALDRVETNCLAISSLTAGLDEELEALVVSLHLQLSNGRVARIRDFLSLDEERVAVEPARQYPQAGIKSFGFGLFPKPPVLGIETTYRYFNYLRPGMLVLSQVKGWEGAIAICPEPLGGFYASPEYRTFSCDIGSSEPEYLDALIRTSWFRGLLAEATRGQGARRERVRPEKFQNIELPMPTVEQQRGALAILRKLKAVPTLTQERSGQAEALLSSSIEAFIPARPQTQSPHFAA